MITAILIVVSFAAGTKYGARLVFKASVVVGKVFLHLRDEFKAIEDEIEKL